MTGKSLLIGLSTLILLLSSCSTSPKVGSSVPYKVKDGVIVLDTPKRPEGQKSALKMACEPIDTVRVGFVGLGMRGSGAVYRYTYIEGVKVTAVCDLLPERAEAANATLEGRGFPKAREYSGEEGWKELCESDDVDLVYICTPWLLHVPISLYALKHGKHVACEVPAMMNIKDCWDIIDACERGRRHFMMLENCCYDFYEMTALNMAQHGLFGEVYHAEGAYIHNLDYVWDQYRGNWRLDYNSKFRGDNYPTHGFGPICQVMNIHRGDRMEYLVAMDTKAIHGAEVAKEKMGIDTFADGDHTVSLIRTRLGHQMEIHHNVYAARPYSRMYQLTGTEGFASKYPVEQLAVGPNPEQFASKEVFDSLMAEYKHPITAEYEAKARKVGGHGGMDFIMDSRLIHCLRNGLPLDEDVYDAAEWSCVNELSRISIEAGSMPVAVPDFTRGEWDVLDGFSYAE
ncbi:MAG: Gfo/Idh/MocA family oxidoreductase [Bacteroidales bacterium]|nr:Gfo/Idh/MocA family oxidoreductase [Bacteroidales bacterium]